ncbi:MAG TPA: hypothetical protein VFI24_28845 [Pyrinomonadaceae bacterium]|nr:hypothetical protein [Pyrinomonadaceae bacterium]
MKPVSKINPAPGRTDERGAALITMLLVTVLLLGAGGALITSTMMSANNAVGSTSEMQAYYVAESGMQSALNVLRGNTKPIFTSTDKISFRTAIVPDISNGPNNTGSLRLANWLPYNDAKDPNSLVPISLGTYTGGYRVTVESADLNSHVVGFSTSAVITGSAAGTPSQRTYGTVGGTDEVTIRYSAQSATLSPNPNTYPLISDSNLGSFVIERPVASTKNNVSIPKTSFQIVITQTLPWAATATFEGTFEGSVDKNASSVKATFEKASVKADGATYALNLASGTQVLTLAYSTSPTSTTIAAKVTSPEPKRLLLKSYGFGPQGAKKRLELMLSRAFLEIEAPATVTLRGADDCSPLELDSGSSGAKYYSGKDHAGSEAQRPAFAVTPCDEAEADAGIKKHDTVDDPEIGLLTDDTSVAKAVKMPSFLKNASAARSYLNGLQTKAQTVGRYFRSGTTISDSLNKPQFTFVDGDATLTDGAGFLVVTGTLTMRGNANFRGMILVLGEGALIRNGGGNGDILGAVVIASFNRSSGDFLPPTFHTNGGGNSTVQYDSDSLNNGVAAGTNVSGIREF